MGKLFGEQDFVQYWTAFQLFIQGQNPYDVAATRAMQCTLGHDCGNVLVSWNPPWLWLLMAPILWLPFTIAAKAWVIAGIILSAVSALLVADCHGLTPRTALYALVGVFINIPLLLSLGFGQTGTLLLFASALLLHGRVKTDNRLEQALALVLFTIKPHIFFLVGVALLWDELTQRRLTLIGQSLGVLALLIAGLLLVNPMAVPAWLDHFIGSSPADGVGGLTEWNTPTISNFLRLGARGFLGNYADIFLVVTPLVSVLFLGWWLQRNPALRWQRLLPPLLALSLWIAPYGWAYDWALLGLLQASILCRRSGGGPNSFLWLMTGAIVAAQFVAGYMTFGLHLSLETMVWLPGVLLALWYLAGKIPVDESRAALES